ncbi:MAG: DUF411 domain-containing protein [Pyrobaculum sp.]
MKKRGRVKSGRNGVLLYLSVAAVALLLLALGLATRAPSQPSGGMIPAGLSVYKTPQCGCCEEYVNYLKGLGVEVKVVTVSEEELSNLKTRLGIPAQLSSCHTSIVEGYFVEGHVPMEAIIKLIKERPGVDGIALPGMPQGSPGMGGEKRGPFKIYAKRGDLIFVFTEI